MKRRLFSTVDPSVLAHTEDTVLDAVDDSMEAFFQDGVPAAEREDTGIQSVFLDVFPVKTETAVLDFIGYDLGPPKWSAENCERFGFTYSRPLRAHLRLIVKSGDRVLSVDEGSVSAGEVLIPHGHYFIVHGNKRVVPAQLHRSPGTSIQRSRDSKSANVPDALEATIMPEKGCTLVVSRRKPIRRDESGWMYRLSSRTKKKAPLYLLLAALGVTIGDFSRKMRVPGETVSTRGSLRGMFMRRLLREVKGPDGSVLGEPGDTVGWDMVSTFRGHGVKEIVLVDDKDPRSEIFLDMAEDSDARDQKIAIMSVWNAARAAVEDETRFDMNVLTTFYNLLFNSDSYTLGKAGMFQFESILPDYAKAGPEGTITVELLAGVVEKLASDSPEETKSYDLHNRWLKFPGEILKEVLGEGLREAAVKTVKFMSENAIGQGTLPKHVWRYGRDVEAKMDSFSTGEMCQIADVYNPLSLTSHATRFTMLGPGGLSSSAPGVTSKRTNVPLEARDIYDSHFGRISPVDSVEGANIGLTGYLSINAGVDEHGFLTTPVVNLKTSALERLSPQSDSRAVTAFADSSLKERPTRKIDHSRYVARAESAQGVGAHPRARRERGEMGGPRKRSRTQT